MRILVTGSAGFIGFHLVNKLLTNGHDVVGIDSINDYYDVQLKLGRLQASGIATDNIVYNEEIKSSAYGNYVFYKMKLEDDDAIEKIFARFQFEVVINLAAQAGVRYSVENPKAYISSNVLGFVNILECCKQWNVKHLLYASSSSVYGMSKEEIFSTKQNVDHPVSVYAASKRSNELMAHVYSNIYNLPTTGLRFFTVYGPWGRPDMALFLFTKAILNGEEIKVYNNGDMLRDFTYIDDIVEGIARIVDAEPPVKEQNIADKTFDPSSSYAPYKVYNIGNSQPVKLLDFIELIEQETGRQAHKKFLPIQPGDVYKTYADVSPLINQFNYKPSTHLHKGVRRFVNWYRDFYKV